MDKPVQTVAFERTLADAPLFHAAAKRLLDIVISLLGLVFMLLPMILFSLLIYLDDPQGSPVFVQVRCGKHGKPFCMLKLRSMRVDAQAHRGALEPFNEMAGNCFKMQNDPRVTGVGKWLRRMFLDEMPQLWNVLIGDMSLVGPRPMLPEEAEACNAAQREILHVKPGMTCLWQVAPARYQMHFSQRAQLDLRYIREQSTGLDLRILLRTIRAVCRGEGL